ncbi:hypothetical protein GUJ93_ZPchr0012g21976 [Zizania palustris]|uniref:Uncharacterized protein n=1 Tax=Zizania palustris TaxID=103762 RepID=A0A8J6BS53_ZIZPA|nr:hypothetical protein GUJ93_ZPchr0012g21976 [Zizania palustris]
MASTLPKFPYDATGFPITPSPSLIAVAGAQGDYEGGDDEVPQSLPLPVDEEGTKPKEEENRNKYRDRHRDRGRTHPEPSVRGKPRAACYLVEAGCLVALSCSKGHQVGQWWQGVLGECWCFCRGRGAWLTRSVPPAGAPETEDLAASSSLATRTIDLSRGGDVFEGDRAPSRWLWRRTAASSKGRAPRRRFWRGTVESLEGGVRGDLVREPVEGKIVVSYTRN